MANHISTKKAIRQIARKNSVNTARTSQMRTSIRRVLEAVESGNAELARTKFVEAQSLIMKNVTKGLLKLNTASRKVANLAGKVKRISTK